MTDIELAEQALKRFNRRRHELKMALVSYPGWCEAVDELADVEGEITALKDMLAEHALKVPSPGGYQYREIGEGEGWRDCSKEAYEHHGRDPVMDTRIKPMAEGCRSARSPCSHQCRDPYTLCAHCDDRQEKVDRPSPQEPVIDYQAKFDCRVARLLGERRDALAQLIWDDEDSRSSFSAWSSAKELARLFPASREARQLNEAFEKADRIIEDLASAGWRAEHPDQAKVAR